MQDCLMWQEIKQGMYASAHAQVVAKNLKLLIEGGGKEHKMILMLRMTLRWDDVDVDNDIEIRWCWWGLWII